MDYPCNIEREHIDRDTGKVCAYPLNLLHYWSVAPREGIYVCMMGCQSVWDFVADRQLGGSVLHHPIYW